VLPLARSLALVRVTKTSTWTNRRRRWWRRLRRCGVRQHSGWGCPRRGCTRWAHCPWQHRSGSGKRASAPRAPSCKSICACRGPRRPRPRAGPCASTRHFSRHGGVLCTRTRPLHVRYSPEGAAGVCHSARAGRRSGGSARGRVPPSSCCAKYSGRRRLWPTPRRSAVASGARVWVRTK
jgi:hypothetical protein